MGRLGVEVLLSSTEETVAFGARFGEQLAPGTTLLLYGDLGAGKTTFVQGLASSLQIDLPIQSPTFTYLHIYEGKCPLYHFDLYRMKDEKDFFAMGFDEYFSSDGICVIEWPERLGNSLPIDARSLHFSYEGQMRKCLGDIWDC